MAGCRMIGRKEDIDMSTASTGGLLCLARLFVDEGVEAGLRGLGMTVLG